MLILITLTALLNKLILCYDDNNESRYIDLLPEVEKEQFLERIARRIQEDSGGKDNVNSKHSVEITEDQLNDHHEFVQKILREESENRRKTKPNDHSNGANSEILTVKSLDKTEKDLVNETDIVVRKETTNTIDSTPTINGTYIKVDIKYDKDNFDSERKDIETPLPMIDNKTHKGETDKSIDTDPDKSDVEDIQVRNFRNDIKEKNHDKDNIQVVSSDKVELDAKLTESNTDVPTTVRTYQDTGEIDNLKQITENLQLELVTINPEIEVYSDDFSLSKGTSDTTEFSTYEDTTRNDVVSDVITTILPDTSRISETIKTTDKNVKVKRSEELKIVEKEVSLIRNNETAFQNSKHTTEQELYNIKEIQSTTEKIVPLDIKSPLNNTGVNAIKESSVDEKITKSKLNTKNKITKHENHLNKDKLNLFQANYSKDGFTKGTLRALRIIKPMQVNIMQDKSFRGKLTKQEPVSKYSLTRKRKGNNGYGIPPNQHAFQLQNNSKMSRNYEQPFYIPTHNYSPNHAYFNARNRYGLNFDYSKLEVDKYEKDKDDRWNNIPRSPYKQREFNIGKKTDQNLRAHFQIQTSTFPPVNHFAPVNYMNIGYFLSKKDVPYLRTEPKQNFPESDEETHPFSNLNNVKSHIRAIRQILLQQKRFGFIQQLNTSEFRSAENKKVKITTQVPSFIYKRDSKNDEASAEDNNVSVDYNNRFKSDILSSKLIDILTKEFVHVKHLKAKKHRNLPPNVFQNKRYKIKTSEMVLHSVEAEKDNGINQNLRIKMYSPMSKPVNQSRLVYDPFHTIVDMTDENDLFDVLEKLKAANITKTRSLEESNKLDPYVEVMREMVDENSKALTQYDWLGTAVDIQAAIKKLQDLVNSVIKQDKIHPSDMELLKYVIEVYKDAKVFVQKEIKKSKLRKRLLPKVYTKRKKYLMERGLINRVWLLRGEGFIDTKVRDLILFNDFLYDLQNSIYGLHGAIKQIASITNVHNQRWFPNLKELYVKGDRREILQLILHLSLSRLFGLIEENSVDIETNFKLVSKDNNDFVKDTVEECKFILVILKEIGDLLYLSICSKKKRKNLYISSREWSGSYAAEHTPSPYTLT